MKGNNWRELRRSKQARQRDSIPEEWIVSPSLYQPIQTHLNVLELPISCGLLTSLEVRITETTDVDAILDMLRTSQWSSVEVTKAFYKRAMVAHQTVVPKVVLLSVDHTDAELVCLDKLFD
jgi:amidase